MWKYILLIVILGVLFFFNLVVHPGQMLYAEVSDLITYHSFWSFLNYKSLKDFSQFPLWSSYRFSGEPGIGNPQNQPFYPLNSLLLFFSPQLSCSFSFMFHFLLAGLFMFLYLRRKVGDFASFVGAICYMFSLKSIAHTSAGHINFIISLAYLPLLFHVLEKALEGRNFCYSIVMGICLSLGFLGGHPQLFLYISFVLFLFFIFNLVSMLVTEKDTKKGLRWCFLFIFAFVVCMGLSAILFLPCSEFTRLVLRSRPRWSMVSFGSLSFENLILLAIPGFWGYLPHDTYKGAINFWEECVYVGIMPLMLAISGIVFQFRKKTVVFYSFLAVFALVFALGKHAPLLHLFYRYVPKFNLFRQPSRMISIFVFAISVLAAFGSDFLTGQIANNRKRMLKIFFCVLFIFSIGTVFLLGRMVCGQTFLLEDVPFLYRSPAFGLRFLVLVLCLANLAIFLVAWNKLKRRHLGFAVTGIILLDLWVYGLPLIQVRDPARIFAKTEAVRFLEKDKTRFRIWDLSKEVPDHIAVRSNIEKIGGADPLILKSYVEFTNCLLHPSGVNLLPGKLPISRVKLHEELFFNIIDLLNTKYVVSKQKIDVPNLELVHQGHDKKGKDIYIFENLNVFPRAFIVRKARVITGVKAAYRELRTFDPRQYVILNKDFHTLHNSGEFKEADIVYYSSNKIDVSVDLASPGFLVLSENWYPGWKAYDNGVEKEILKVNYTLRGLYLEKGRHKVSFVFRPRSYELGRRISLATLIFVVTYLGYGFYLRIRKV